MKYTIIGVAVVLVAYFGLMQVVYIDRRYINIFTGSTKGHLEIPIFGNVKSWHKQSIFEQRLRKIKGLKIEEEFISCAGTGKTLFGIPRSHGHGNPGHSVYLASDSLTDTIIACSDDEIRELYQINLRKDSKAFDLFIKNIVGK
jgi:hypothetical protein